ncbi:MAG: hypothetical protein OXF85_02895 [Candidatus Saccharibacteria bacterium]|nr:hypothetical protein [Candidatus Saccharibacteria bacterium]
MDLKNFIEEAIYSIAGACRATHTQIGGLVDFDICVNVEQSKGKSGRGNIRVINLVAGEAEVKKNMKLSHASRIQFKLNVSHANLPDESPK